MECVLVNTMKGKVFIKFTLYWFNFAFLDRYTLGIGHLVGEAPRMRWHNHRIVVG